MKGCREAEEGQMGLPGQGGTLQVVVHGMQVVQGMQVVVDKVQVQVQHLP